MTDSELPAVVGLFLEQYVDSVLQLEALLLLRAQPERRLSAEQVALELRVDARGARSELDALAARGLLTKHEPAPDSTYQYTAVAPLQAVMDELAKLYVERRVSIVSKIFAKPLERIRVFADAFKFGKKD